MSFLDEIATVLNPQQLEAVKHGEGPLLVLAGAGSGKTRVLTSRIAHLVIDRGYALNQILAMTFSNKAAREMHDRLKILLKDPSPNRYPWISTFHSVGVRLLRRCGQSIGISPDFVIYDTGDQIDLIKTAFKNRNVSDKAFSHRAIHSRISGWKNDAKLPQDVAGATGSGMDEIAAGIYEEYQMLLKQAQAMDFDDLLLETYRLLQEDEGLRSFLRQQWQHVLIDEFQDTNKIQYLILESILNDKKSVCVVGDDDQSIYGWRGARVENILNFDRVFQGCKVVKLEQNYRSTGNILKAAASVINKNELRHEKTLWTEAGDGALIRTAILPDDKAEARFVVDEIKKLVREGVSAKDIAVLYRINSISRNFEEECLRKRLPYKIIGGFRFYERREIKDVLSYLKLILNPADIVAFRRTVNTPARGIGKVSQGKLEDAANKADRPLADYLVENRESLPLTGKAKAGIQAYIDVLAWGRDAIQQDLSLTDLVCAVLEKSQYLYFLKQEKSEEARDREANLQELLSAVQEFEEQWAKEAEAREEVDESEILNHKLFDFLERVALIADNDQLDQVKEDQVTFMSLHAAKGLEFGVCFIAAMEDGTFPSIRSFDSPDELEEERRLCYVGITRAKQRLYLTRAESRRTFGNINYQMASRFLRDLPAEVLENYVDESESDEDFSYGGTFSFRKKKKPEYDEFNQDSGADFQFDQELDCFSYNRGDRVKHPSFGPGIVRKVEMLGSDECLTIDFSSKGRKRVLSQFVQRSA